MNSALSRPSLAYYIFLVLLIGFSFPSQVVGFGTLILLFVFFPYVAKCSLNFCALLFLYIYFSSFLFYVFENGLSQIVRSFVFFVFLLPLFFLQVYRAPRFCLRKEIVKKTFECFFKIQILFSVVTVAYFVVSAGFKGFDTTFGDIIAGTFRIPFIFLEDSANKTFSFSMVLLLTLYFYYFRGSINRLLVVLVICLIFFASVTHITILAVLCLGLVNLKFDRRFLYFAIISLLAILGYRFLQPINFNLIVFRVTSVFDVISSPQGFNNIGDKAVFITNFFHDILENWVRFLFFGFGEGGYSSRSALLLSGAFGGAGILEPTNFMQGNVLPLLNSFLEKELWERGAFYFPYNGVFSLMAELGLLGFCLFSLIIFRSLLKVFVERKYAIFVFSFLFSVNMVDHYFEYFNGLALFLIFVVLGSSFRRYE